MGLQGSEVGPAGGGGRGRALGPVTRRQEGHRPAHTRLIGVWRAGLAFPPALRTDTTPKSHARSPFRRGRPRKLPTRGLSPQPPPPPGWRHRRGWAWEGCLPGIPGGAGAGSRETRAATETPPGAGLRPAGAAGGRRSSPQSSAGRIAQPVCCKRPAPAPALQWASGGGGEASRPPERPRFEGDRGCKSGWTGQVCPGPAPRPLGRDRRGRTGPRVLQWLRGHSHPRMSLARHGPARPPLGRREARGPGSTPPACTSGGSLTLTQPRQPWGADERPPAPANAAPATSGPPEPAGLPEAEPPVRPGGPDAGPRRQRWRPPPQDTGTAPFLSLFFPRPPFPASLLFLAKPPATGESASGPEAPSPRHPPHWQDH